MSKSKAEKDNRAASQTEGSSKRKPDHPTTSRSDIFSKLVKLVGLSECCSTKPSISPREGPGELVAIGRPPAHSPVTVHLASTTSLLTSSSKETLRSSSDSNLAVSAANDGTTLAQGTDPLSIAILAPTHGVDGPRSKQERKSIRRKAKITPLSEPATCLTTIPEIASVFERNSLLPDLSSSPDSKHYAYENALMDTDSIRARTAIALARAQLEHSRPASYNRKLERSSNRMMMLPNELEEHMARTSERPSLIPTRERSSSIPARVHSSTRNKKSSNHGRTNEVSATREAVGQSQAIVLTLMAAKEAISQRATIRKNYRSPLTVDLSKRSNKPFQGLYQAGDIPPSPPPSIPLPCVPPPSIPPPQLPPKPAVTVHRSQPTTPKREQSRRNGVVHSPGAYKGLPTEYRTDDEMLKHIDTLMQGLPDSHSGQEVSSRKVCYSLPSISGRGRSGSQSTVDSARRSERPQMVVPSESMPVLRPTKRDHDSPLASTPPPPVPRAYYELRLGSLSGSTKTPNLKPVSFGYYDALLNPCAEDGTLIRPRHETPSRDMTFTSTFSSGHAEKYFQPSTPHRSMLQPASPKPSRPGRGGVHTQNQPWGYL